MKNFILTFSIILASFISQSQDPVPRILNLQECIEIAIDNNLNVQRSRLQVENAKTNLYQSKASALPNLNLGGSYGYNWGRSIDPTSNDFINEQISFAGVNGSASMMLFNWFNISNSIKQNRLLYESSEFDLQRTSNDISLNISIYYLNVILNRELVQNATYELKSVEEQLMRTKKLVAGGALPLTSELELTSQQATMEVNLVKSQNALDLALLNLKQAMLIPTHENLDIVIPTIDPDNIEFGEKGAEEIYLMSLENMPEIKSAMLQVEGAAIGVKIAQSGYAPSLSLNGNFRSNYSDAFKTFIVDSTQTPFLFPTDYVVGDGNKTPVLVEIPNGSIETLSFRDQLDRNLSRSLTVNLSIPVFNNLRVKSNEQRARIGLQQAEIAVMEQKNQLRQSIESSFNDALASKKTYQASIKQIRALEETFRVVENQFNLGAANFTEYLVASNNLYRAKSDLVRAKYDLIFKIKILDFYQGKTLSL